MLFRALQHSPRAIIPCASCRLRASIAAKAVARSKGAGSTSSPARSLLEGRAGWKGVRSFGTSVRRREERRDEKDSQLLANEERASEDEGLDVEVQAQEKEVFSTPEEAALRAREMFGDALPEDYLSQEEMRVYERLYGPPLKYVEEEVDEDGGVAVEEEEGVLRTGVLKEGRDGELEEVEFDEMEDTQNEADEKLAEDIEVAFYRDPEATDQEEEDEGGSSQRTHPITAANRFATNPTTLELPQDSLVGPVNFLLSRAANVHLKEAAHRILGEGLPHSTSTPKFASRLQQKPIPLDAAKSSMSEIEGDVFLASLVPGMYASIMSVLVETRKRLGTKWAEELVHKAQRGELSILDAGGGGAGILAVREVLKAEWERMHEDNSSLGSGMALAEADGKIGGPGAVPPLGAATVLTGSDVLRHRASRLLENTTFVPRLPDYVHTEEPRKKGKFDIILAPHTLWPLREDHMRKTHLRNLWDLLSHDGGVLLVLEKGVPRGFELIASGRQMLLDTRMASDNFTETLRETEVTNPSRHTGKDQAMIVAPCTNHAACPMYQPQGMIKGRRNVCHFKQRYARPPFLQRILGAKSKNWEDVKFSYLSVMRGRDLRNEENFKQDEEAAQMAFEGYPKQGEEPAEEEGETAPSEATYPHSLTLPRQVLAPMKRHGHVVMDVCTPHGAYERWVVPRSFGRQAYRDARKSSWGDLWALGAKTRITQIPKIKKRVGKADLDAQGASVKGGKKKGWDADEFGQIVASEVEEGGKGGKVRKGRKIKGIRDKRDKKGQGNGRRKNSR